MTGDTTTTATAGAVSAAPPTHTGRTLAVFAAALAVVFAAAFGAGRLLPPVDDAPAPPAAPAGPAPMTGGPHTG